MHKHVTSDAVVHIREKSTNAGKQNMATKQNVSVVQKKVHIQGNLVKSALPVHENRTALLI